MSRDELLICFGGARGYALFNLHMVRHRVVKGSNAVHCLLTARVNGAEARKYWSEIKGLSQPEGERSDAALAA